MRRFAHENAGGYGGGGPLVAAGGGSEYASTWPDAPVQHNTPLRHAD